LGYIRFYGEICRYIFFVYFGNIGGSSRGHFMIFLKENKVYKGEADNSLSCDSIENGGEKFKVYKRGTDITQ